MKKIIFYFLISLITLNAQSQSNGDTSEKLNRAVKETEILTRYFVDQISRNYSDEAQLKGSISFPYAPTDSEVLSLVDEYHLLMLSLLQDFSLEELTSRNYLKKLQENSAVKNFQSELYDQIIILKEGFQKDTKQALEGIGKE